ncbi:uncharacterized protein IWZ02DRAFT_437847 [Phyllosticta citriasiana]|uniref:uncharacterized protein n=1 Tax=Phyllosticta citriasiana TaxID=595635 RepID=UPI0030FDCD44
MRRGRGTANGERVTDVDDFETLEVVEDYGYVRSLPEIKWYDNMSIDSDSADEEDEDGGGYSAAQHRHNRAGAAAVAKTKGHRRPWTAEDTALMLELKDQGLPYAAIAERLGRTDKTVAGRIKYIKERSAERQLYRIWTPEDNALLLTLRDDEELGFKTIAERLGRTKAQVVTQHKRLAVKEKREGNAHTPLDAAPPHINTTTSSPRPSQRCIAKFHRIYLAHLLPLQIANSTPVQHDDVYKLGFVHSSILRRISPLQCARLSTSMNISNGRALSSTVKLFAFLTVNIYDDALVVWSVSRGLCNCCWIARRSRHMELSKPAWAEGVLISERILEHHQPPTKKRLLPDDSVSQRAATSPQRVRLQRAYSTPASKGPEAHLSPFNLAPRSRTQRQPPEPDSLSAFHHEDANQNKENTDPSFIQHSDSETGSEDPEASSRHGSPEVEHGRPVNTLPSPEPANKNLLSENDDSSHTAIPRAPKVSVLVLIHVRVVNIPDLSLQPATIARIRPRLDISSSPAEANNFEYSF